jgi:hypothetical protein
MDNVNKIIYLIGLDMNGGVMKCQIELPFLTENFGEGEGLAVDPDTSNIFVFGQSSISYTHTILR